VPQDTKYVSAAHQGAAADEQSCYNMNSVSEVCNEHLDSRSPSMINEDAGQTSTESASHPKTDNFCRLPVSAGGLFDHISSTLDSVTAAGNVMHCQMTHDSSTRSHLPIGRSTTV